MTKKYTNLYGFIHTVGDILILNGAYLVGYYFSFLSFDNFGDPKYLQLWIYLNIIYLLSANISGSLELYRNTRFSQIFNSLLKLFFFQIVLAFRLEKFANDKLGRILTCRVTRQMAGPQFRFRDLGEMKAKGFDKPDRVFALEEEVPPSREPTAEVDVP